MAEFRKMYIPDGIIEKMVNPKKTDRIIDIGAGDGHFSFLFAKKAGRVIVVDSSDKAIEIVKSVIEDKSVKNISVFHADICEGIPENSFNKVFFGTSFHDIPCREKLMQEILSKGTEDLKVTFLEFKKNGSFGPPMEMRLSEDELSGIMHRYGLKLESHDELEIHYIHTYSRA